MKIDEDCDLSFQHSSYMKDRNVTASGVLKCSSGLFCFMCFASPHLHPYLESTLFLKVVFIVILIFVCICTCIFIIHCHSFLHFIFPMFYRYPSPCFFPCPFPVSLSLSLSLSLYVSYTCIHPHVCNPYPAIYFFLLS